MNRKITKIISIIFMIIFATNLWGCTLASEESVMLQESDQLIGGLVTREPIGKTYGTCEWIKPMNAPEHIDDIQFKGIEGMFFYGYDSMIYSTDEEVFIWGRGEHMNVNGSIKEEDGKQEIRLYAETYYVSKSDREEERFYLNPVYQTADKQVYVLPGEGALGAIGADAHTLSFKQENRRTLNDDTVVDGFEISVKLQKIEEPLHIWMTQMTEDDEVIKTEEFFPEESTAQLMVEPETAYILLETETRLKNGESVMRREIVEWEGEMATMEDENGKQIERKSSHFFTYYPVVDGFYGKDWTYIDWLD